MNLVTRWRKHSALVGVDIGPDAIRLLQWAREEGGLCVSHHAHEPLPAGTAMDNTKAVGAAIARARARAGTHTRHAVVALAAQAVRIRVLSLPASLNAAELEARLEIEAARLLPTASGSPYLDFAVFDHDTNPPGEVQVLLAVADPEAVRCCQAALKTAGLHAAVIELEALALARSLSVLAGQPLPPEAALALTQNSAVVTNSAPQLAAKLPEKLAGEAPAWLLACGLALSRRPSWTFT